MSEDTKLPPVRTLFGAQPDKPTYRDAVEENSDRAVLAGASLDHQLGDAVAAKTESPFEAEIDKRNGLRQHTGRTPVPEDFDGLLTSEGNSGDVVGADVTDSVFVLGEDGSTGRTL